MATNLTILRRIATGCVALIALAISGCACGQLYSNSVKEPPKASGKPLEVYYREIERGDGYSLVEYRYVSGASVPASLFGMRGHCAIARREGWSHFANEGIEGAQQGWSRYRVFRIAPADRRADSTAPDRLRSIALDECVLLGQ